MNLTQDIVATEPGFKITGFDGAADPADTPNLGQVETLIAAATAGLPTLTEFDASGNPDYPAAVTVGDRLLISVAGIIGGASGKPVNVGDEVVANTINAGGDEAAVGAYWDVQPTAATVSQMIQDAADAGTSIPVGGTKYILSDTLNPVGGTPGDRTPTPLLGLIPPGTVWQLLGYMALTVLTADNTGETNAAQYRIGSDAQDMNNSITVLAPLGQAPGDKTISGSAFTSQQVEQGTTDIGIFVDESNTLDAILVAASDATAKTLQLRFLLVRYS